MLLNEIRDHLLEGTGRCRIFFLLLVLLLFRFLPDSSRDLEFISSHRSVACQSGFVLSVDNIDRNTYAHAGIRVGGGRVGLHVGNGTVLRHNTDRSVHLLLVVLRALRLVILIQCNSFYGNTAADSRIRDILLDIQRETCCYGDAALAGLRTLASRCGAADHGLIIAARSGRTGKL